MYLRKAIIICLLSCLLIFSHAQILPFEKYTSKNGLISDRITAITQDEKGYMWFGSFFGICRYDGINFEKINLPTQQQNKYVQSIKAVNHKVYATFMFGGGLSEYNNGQIHYYFLKGKDSISKNEFLILKAENDGTLYLANALNEIYTFHNGVFKLFEQIDLDTHFRIKCMEKDNNGNFWIGTERGLFILPFQKQQAIKYFPELNVFQIYKNNEGKLWIASRTSKATQIYKTMGWVNGTFLSLKTFQLPAVKLIEPEGNLSKGFWYLDESKGLFIVDTNGKSNYYKTALELYNDIRAVYTDRENNLWIANEPGLLKITDLSIQSFLFNELALAGGFICNENDSSIWVTNSRSIYHITNNAMKKVEALKMLKPDLYSFLHFDKSRSFLIGFWNEGICTASIFREKIKHPKFLMNYKNIIVKASALIDDHYGNTLIAGFNGIFILRNGQIVDHYQPLNASGGGASINCIAIDENSHAIWLGDNNTGVIRLQYRIRRDSSYQFLNTKYISTSEGLTDNYVRSIYVDTKRNVWLGTRYGGIFRINNGDGDHFKVINCSETAHLACTRVTSIAEEDSTAVWFATCDGVYRYSLNNSMWRHYNASNGLLNNEIYSISVDSKNKILWALSAQGITKFPTTQERSSQPPIVTISSVAVLGKVNTEAIQERKELNLSYNENSIGFTFTAPSFIDEKKVFYKYLLQGYDNKWSEPVATNSINYASLPPGKYVFKVMAANAKGEWSSSPSQFAFEITMPFYRSAWFIFMSFTLLLFIIYLVRIQKLKNRYNIEKLRLNIARDLHDDIGSALGSINILSQTASRKLEKDLTPDQIHPIFQRIGQSAEGTLEAMDDIVWAINPDKDKIEDIIVRMREYAIPLLEAKNITFDFTCKGNNDKPIAMNLRRNMFLIFKETINNILKHSFATYVSIELEIHPTFLSLRVHDNGKGFDKNIFTSRNGLRNMQLRAKSVNGTIDIDTSGTGTFILFKAAIR